MAVPFTDGRGNHCQVDPRRLYAVVAEAIAGQEREAARTALTAAVERDDVELYGRDGDGFHTVAVGGAPLVRVHFTRLLPGCAADGN